MRFNPQKLYGRKPGGVIVLGGKPRILGNVIHAPLANEAGAGQQGSRGGQSVSRAASREMKRLVSHRGFNSITRKFQNNSREWLPCVILASSLLAIDYSHQTLPL